MSFMKQQQAQNTGKAGIDIMSTISNLTYGPIVFNTICSAIIIGIMGTNKELTNPNNTESHIINLAGIIIVLITLLSAILMGYDVINKTTDTKETNGYKLSLVPFVLLCFSALLFIIMTVMKK